MREIDFETVMKIHIPRWNELPEIDLYLDQVVNYIEKYLGQYNANKEDKIITKTMINNYVKQGIMPAPTKKKYNRQHIAYLIVICVLKQVYSISEIKELIALALEINSAENGYNRFCDYLTEALISTFNGSEYSKTSTFTPEQYLMKNVVQSFANKLYAQIVYLNK